MSPCASEGIGDDGSVVVLPTRFRTRAEKLNRRFAVNRSSFFNPDVRQAY